MFTNFVLQFNILILSLYILSKPTINLQLLLYDQVLQF